MVFGDFDADGLTGLAILVRALRRFGIEAVPYVPSRLDEGHGLSRKAIAAAVEAGVRVIATVDCGSTSGPEIAEAQAAGIDVLVTDHHRVPPELPAGSRDRQPAAGGQPLPGAPAGRQRRRVQARPAAARGGARRPVRRAWTSSTSPRSDPSRTSCRSSARRGRSSASGWPRSPPGRDPASPRCSRPPRSRRPRWTSKGSRSRSRRGSTPPAGSARRPPRPRCS